MATRKKSETVSQAATSTLINGKYGAPLEIAVSEDGTRAAVFVQARGANGLWIWDLADTPTARVQDRSILGHTRWLHFVGRGAYLAGHQGVGSMFLWDAATGNEVLTFATAFTGMRTNNAKGPATDLSAFDVAPDLRMAVCTSLYEPMLLWEGDFANREIKSVKQTGTLGEEPEGAHACVFSPDGRLLATDAKGVQLWDMQAKKKDKLLRSKTWDGIAMRIAWSTDGKTIAAIDETKHLSVFDVSSGETVFEGTVPALGALAVTSAREPRAVVVGRSGVTVTDGTKVLAALAATKPKAAAISQDGSTVVVGAKESAEASVFRL